MAVKEQDNSVVRKRAVYYSLLPQGFNSTDMVDEYLAYIFQLLTCSRSELGIEASPKGLLAGANLTSTDSFEFMQVASKFVNMHRDSESTL